MRTGNKQTDRQRTNRQTENSKPEATLIPMDSWGERANYEVQIQNFKTRNLKSRGEGKATSGYAWSIGSLTAQYPYSHSG